MAEDGSSDEHLMEFELIGHTKLRMGRGAERTVQAPTPARSPKHDPAPDMALRAPDGRAHRLSEFRGQNVVLHVFDKDKHVAAREAKALQQHLSEFQALNAQVVGIAPAGLRAQARFAKKNDIRFMMLSDKDRRMMGRLGTKGNTTVIIDEDGRIDKVYRAGARADRDTDRVLRHLRAIGRTEQWDAEGQPPA